MKNFVAYHKVEEWGEYECEEYETFNHYSRHKIKRLQKAIGQNVWVISGTRVNKEMIYELCAVYQPTEVEEDDDGWNCVSGEGRGVNPHIKLNDFPWFSDLIKEQNKFSYGLNKISSSIVIEGLMKLANKDNYEFNFNYADELPSNKKFLEGAKVQVTVNSYERNQTARKACIEYYGLNCLICGFSFENQYGNLGKEYIHVHHLYPLSAIGEEYEVDPIKHLIPICPNCHAMIHRKDPPFTPEELVTFIKKKF